MIKDTNSKFDDYSISPKIKQILLHFWIIWKWFVMIYFFIFYFFVNIKYIYYWFNKRELLQKAKEKYDNDCKEKSAKYYQANKDVI